MAGDFTPAGIELQIKGLNKFLSNLGRVDKKTKSTGKAFLSVSTIVGAAAVSGLIAFGKAAVEEGRAFTKAMSGVGAISGAVGVELEALEKQAKNLGATTKFTAVEAAAGMKFLAQAGFETTDILSALPPTLTLAASANIGLGKSADIVSNVLKGFGAEADQTGKFVDVLTNTFTTSNTDLIQLGGAMKNVAPVASKLGLSVEETAAAIGKMGDAGIQGGAAGTQLKNALLNLAAPSAQQAELMKKLGIEIFDASGEMKSLPEVIGAVNQGLAGLSQEQQVAAVKTLAGKRAIAGFQVLLNEGQPELERYTQEVSKIGTASEIATKQLDNLEGDITLLNSAFSGFKLAAFELMEPTLRAASKALTGFVTDLSQGAASWNQVFKDVSAIREWQEANVRAALEAGKSYGPYTGQVRRTIGPIEEVTQTTFELIRANQEYQGIVEQVTIANEAELKGLSNIAQQGSATAGALDTLLGITSELAVAEIDATQQSVELSRNRSFLVTESDKLAAVTAQIKRETEAYEQAQIDAAAAEEDRQRTTLSLLSTLGTFVSGTQDARETQLEGEQNFNTSIANLRESAAESQVTAKDAANKKILSLEEKRAAEEHRILTGAHARTTELNDSLLATNNAHFQELKDAEKASLDERQEAIVADFAARESQAQAARAKELAEQQAHLQELQLNAALATLESVGQLQQFTGGLAVSANEAADLIRAGVIPVTAELGAAIQGTFAGLQQEEAKATAQVASNQAILQEAFAGTLVPLEAQAMALGTGVPAAAVAAQTATGLANADIVAGAQSAALAAQEQDLSLQNLGMITFPTLGAAAQVATQTMNEAFTTLASPVDNVDLALNNIATITLALLQEMFLVATTLIIEQLLLLLQTGIMPIDLALVTITTVTLPALQAMVITVAAASIAALLPVQALLEVLVTLMSTLTAETQAWGKAVETAAKKATKGFKAAADIMRSELIPAMQRAKSVAEALANALLRVVSSSKKAGKSSKSVTGTGFAQGIGFQAGTPANTNGALGLGFKIPEGFPNDSFGPLFAQSGEEMLITPRGTSIESLVLSRLADLIGGGQVSDRPVATINNFNFNTNITTSQPARATLRQYEVMRGLLSD